jgi:hypothetical protein
MSKNSIIVLVWMPYLSLLIAGFQPRWRGFDTSSGYVGFMVDIVAMGPIFSEYFGFLCQFSSHQLFYAYLSPVAGRVGPACQVGSVSVHSTS